MRKKLTSVIAHPLIAGSIIVSVGSLVANFINFIFNIFISRNLSVQDYGTVATLMAIITLFGISAGAVMPTIVNFTGESFAKNNLPHVRGIYLKIAKPLVVIALVVALSFVLFNALISNFLNIQDGSGLVIISGLIIFVGFMSVLNLALFQAKLSFLLLSLLGISSSLVKVLLGVFLVFSGLKSLGVMSAILVAYIIPYISGFYFLKFLFSNKVNDVEINFSDILKYAAPSGLALLALTAISSVDLVLVKHLFDTNSAGIYAGLSLVGKVIFFFTAPIGMVMFPLMSRRHNNKEKHGSILLVSVFLVALGSLGITVFYFLFPEFVITLFLKNEAYLKATPYLGFFGIFISLHSLSSIMMYYFLSIKKTWIYKPILAAAISQAVLIYLIHNSFAQIITISIICVGLLLLFFLLYFYYLSRKK